MSDFGSMKLVVSKMDRRCEWCGETIPTGEPHDHYVGKWEGEFQNWRMHVECYGAATLSDDLQDGFSPFEYKRGSQEPR